MSAWPTPQNLADELVEAGFTKPSTSRLTSALALAVEAFQDATGWYPFAAQEDAEAAESTLTWPADSAVSVIELGGGVLSSTTPTLTISGDALTAGTDFELRPVDAPRKSQPYTYLKLRGRVLSGNSELKLTGIWGYCDATSVPELARAAVLAYAARDIAAPQVQSGAATRPVSEAKEGDVSRQYGTNIEERQAAIRQWAGDWDAGTKRFTRQRII